MAVCQSKPVGNRCSLYFTSTQTQLRCPPNLVQVEPCISRIETELGLDQNLTEFRLNPNSVHLQPKQVQNEAELGFTSTRARVSF